MAKRNYDQALAALLAHEGGYTNHPSDPGGPTNFGITIADYRKYVKPNATAADVKAMKVEEAKAIYRARYWDAQRCDELPDGVDYAIFDYGVNSGIGRSGKVLRRLMALSDATAVVNDGVITAAAKRDPAELAAAICDERLRFLKSLKTWPVFGNGWGRRVAEVKAAALAMAATAKAASPASPPAPAEAAPGKGEVPEPTVAKTVAKSAPVAAGGGAATVWDWVAAHPLQAGLIAAGVLAAVFVVIHLLNRSRQAKQEAATPGVAFVPAAG